MSRGLILAPDTLFAVFGTFYFMHTLLVLRLLWVTVVILSSSVPGVLAYILTIFIIPKQ